MLFTLTVAVHYTVQVCHRVPSSLSHRVQWNCGSIESLFNTVTPVIVAAQSSHVPVLSTAPCTMELRLHRVTIDKYGMGGMVPRQ